MQVAVQLFAVARQRAGRSPIRLELPPGSNVGDLKRALVAECPELAPLLPSLMIAVDAEYAGEERVIGPGAEVAVIPPVSGGRGGRDERADRPSRPLT